jgi:hypothetical protein
MRLKWIAAIRARENVLGMSPSSAYDKLLARDRIYERSRQTVDSLMPATLSRRSSR